MVLITDGIDHLNLEVIDLQKTAKFYKDLFGFEIKKEQPDEDSYIIGNEKVKLCLYENKKMQKYVKKGFAHLGLHINNFDDIVKKCEEMNLKIYYGGKLEWENSSSIYIQDPNGYEIELSKTFGGGL
ncbi:MAG: VOC family protein [Ignavibacteriales bacterium CG_4_9_14_3_um_filter_30_11]|nr:MAG: VOC family protein [Ignavibacteriales bacterium CG_4_9_14_3_um_filter_30_11]